MIRTLYKKTKKKRGARSRLITYDPSKGTRTQRGKKDFRKGDDGFKSGSEGQSLPAESCQWADLR